MPRARRRKAQIRLVYTSVLAKDRAQSGSAPGMARLPPRTRRSLQPATQLCRALRVHLRPPAPEPGCARPRPPLVPGARPGAVLEGGIVGVVGVANSGGVGEVVRAQRTPPRTKPLAPKKVTETKSSRSPRQAQILAELWSERAHRSQSPMRVAEVAPTVSPILPQHGVRLTEPALWTVHRRPRLKCVPPPSNCQHVACTPVYFFLGQATTRNSVRTSVSAVLLAT